MIPAEAVEALAAVLAQEALVSADMDGHGWDAENDDPAPFMPRARERARTYLEAAAPHMLAEALEEAADEFHARLPDGTGNGRAYNSHQVARILRDRAARIGPTK